MRETRWSVYVYENATTGDPGVSVKSGAAASSTALGCSLPSSLPIRLNLTAGTINGTSCPALEFGEGVGAPYRLSYTYGTRASGRYNLTVDAATVGAVNQLGEAALPFRSPAIYGIRYALTFRTDTVHYRDRVHVTAS